MRVILRCWARSPADRFSPPARILKHLAAYLPGVTVTTSSDCGIDVDAKEAIAFAVLAYQTWRGKISR